VVCNEEYEKSASQEYRANDNGHHPIEGIDTTIYEKGFNDEAGDSEMLDSSSPSVHEPILIGMTHQNHERRCYDQVTL
jgi:hypothetical protein